MNERFTLDRQSFEQILSTASLLQQLQRQAMRSRALGCEDTQSLADLVAAQQAIETGMLDLEGAMKRVVELSLKVTRATGAAVWLFTRTELVYRTSAGSASNDEALRLAVLSNLASACRMDGVPVDAAVQWPVGPTSSVVPGGSHVGQPLLVAPIFQGWNAAGALAVFSKERDVFSEHDSTNVRLLSGLLAHALSKAAEAQLKRSVVLERATMLQTIQRIVPTLERFVRDEEDVQQSSVSGVPFSKVHTAAPDLVTSPSLRMAQLTQEANRQASLVAVKVETPAKKATIRQEVTLDPIAADPAAAQTKATSLVGRVRVAVEGAKARVRIARVRIAPVRIAPVRVRLRGLPRGVPTSALCGGVLLIGIALLLLAGGPDEFIRPTMASSEARATELKQVPVRSNHLTEDGSRDLPGGSQPERLAEPIGPTPHFRVSHMRITDDATLRSIGTLSRFEIPKLKRQGRYGDGRAAFVLGMLYEIGRGVPQSCSKAAGWVAKSAADGNAAAAYNLALRYRDGDGVPVNYQEAMKWFQKAADRGYSKARGLLALASGQTLMQALQAESNPE